MMRFIYTILATMLCCVINSCNSCSNSESCVDDPKELEGYEPDDPLPIPVDLGLPSGTLWGDRNLDAVVPSDVGDKRQWGEHWDEDGYIERNVPNEIRNISGTQYDVVRHILGDKWRMPTKVEFEELIGNCDLKYVEVGNVKGIKVKGKNGNHIFLPLDTYYTGREFGNMELIFYWTGNRVDSNNYNVWCLCSNFKRGEKPVKMGKESLNLKMLIRPVLSK